MWWGSINIIKFKTIIISELWLDIKIEVRFFGEHLNWFDLQIKNCVTHIIVYQKKQDYVDEN
jgi:hypothetical protein